MAGALDPLGLLSPPYNKDFDFLNDSKDASDAVNPCGTSALSSLDPPDPSNRPVESPSIPSVGPIDPALQVFTGDMDNTMPLIHNSAQWPPKDTEHSAVAGSVPPAKRTDGDFFYGDDDYVDAHYDVGSLKNHGKRGSRQSSSSNDSHNRTERSKGGRHQEKNRLAASKSRQKKKKETEKLEAQSRLLEDEQAKLKATADLLQSEVLNLKNEILQHGLCSNCDQIQKYISESANRLVCER
ncbi:hypothetical protein F5X96DRAFT_617421 [Biscogniauxia mediterranea]|nr:hypothetical protein F5X96DRAFT_617421 [Biscogniauxia mediterranea]